MHSCTAALVLALLGCGDTAGPPGPPYLAIVTSLSTWPGATAPATIRYRVRDLAGDPRIARDVRVAPADTVILSVPPASYVVEAIDLPSRCVVQNGAQRGIALTSDDNTGLVRYSIQCRGLVSVVAVADGWDVDQAFVFRVRDGAGREHIGTLAANDTVTLSDAAPGLAEVRLAGVAPNCDITSDGGADQRTDVDATGGAIVAFRVACSDIRRRPQLLDFTSGYHRGASIFQFRVWDPDGDVEGYYWDLTDCRGSSVLSDRRERVRRGLRGGRGALVDTLVAVGAFEVGVADAEMAGRCTELRVFDARGNLTTLSTHRIGSGTGVAPVIRFFNAALVDQTHVRSLLAAADPENDIVGHFVLVRLRDGTLGIPDGQPDLGSMDAAGYVGLAVPEVPTTGRVRWDDIYAVQVYVIDARGNAIKVVDDDIFK